MNHGPTVNWALGPTGAEDLVFSQWDRVFKDPMTTAAAIDRVVHHATILELTAKRSVRGEEAKRRNAALAKKSAPKK